MKYYTIEHHSGQISDKECKALSKAYKLYIDTNYQKMPLVIKLLINDIPLHDGKVKTISINSSDKSLTLTTICGNNLSGYFEICITFSNASYDLSQLKNLAGKSLEILYTEWELLDKGYNYKILFYPYCEISIDLSDVSVKIKAKQMDDYLNFSDKVIIKKI